uniref:COesterase domain-containing protein n=1 Tax=Strongyloides papillosus TaxID=174720 RepID=A0A0N5C6P0_STREA
MGCYKSRYKTDCKCKDNDSCHHKSVKVTTQYGIISGFQYKDPSCIANVFLGIPFAAPPVDKLRFKKPQPPLKWDGILNATKYKAQSIQKPDIITNLIVRVPVREDCLYLNIVTPRFHLGIHKKYPVLVYVHGGSFCNDSAVRYHYSKCASYWVKHGVIAVTIQYRLGFLGYFYTGDDTCQTNNGLWDQYFAIKWVKENISSFHGDPNNITVIGQSAGGVSVDLLSLSPISSNTFHKSIILGGNADTLWAIADKESLQETCRKKAIELGFTRVGKNFDDQWTREDNFRMMEYLEKVPAKLFVLAKSSFLPEKFYESILDLAPVIDDEILPKMPHLLRKEVKLKPTIIGICKYEGLIFAALTKIKNPENLLAPLARGQQTRLQKRGFNLTVSEVENMLGYNDTMKMLIEPKKLMKEVIKTYGDLGTNISIIDFILNRWERQSGIKTFITEGKDLSEIPSTITNIPHYDIQSHSDEASKESRSPSKKMKTLDLVNKKFRNLKNILHRKPSKDVPLYFFRFDHCNRKNFRGISAFFPFIGSTHGTELNYIIGVNQYFVPFTRTKADKKVSFFMTTAITNFAKYGNPNGSNNEGICNIVWDPVKMDPTTFNFNFLRITKDMGMVANYGNGRLLHLAKFYRYLKSKEAEMEENDKKDINNNDINEVVSNPVVKNSLNDINSKSLIEKSEIKSISMNSGSLPLSKSRNTTTV